LNAFRQPQREKDSTPRLDRSLSAHISALFAHFIGKEHVKHALSNADSWTSVPKNPKND
jgi:hypothetical protein